MIQCIHYCYHQGWLYYFVSFTFSLPENMLSYHAYYHFSKIYNFQIYFAQKYGVLFLKSLSFILAKNTHLN